MSTLSAPCRGHAMGVWLCWMTDQPAPKLLRAKPDGLWAQNTSERSSPISPAAFILVPLPFPWIQQPQTLPCISAVQFGFKWNFHMLQNQKLHKGSKATCWCTASGRTCYKTVLHDDSTHQRTHNKMFCCTTSRAMSSNLIKYQFRATLAVQADFHWPAGQLKCDFLLLLLYHLLILDSTVHWSPAETTAFLYC